MASNPSWSCKLPVLFLDVALVSLVQNDSYMLNRNSWCYMNYWSHFRRRGTTYTDESVRPRAPQTIFKVIRNRSWNGNPGTVKWWEDFLITTAMDLFVAIWRRLGTERTKLRTPNSHSCTGVSTQVTWSAIKRIRVSFDAPAVPNGERALG